MKLAAKQRGERLDLRLPGDDKSLFQQAAALMGIDTTAFVVFAAKQAAQQVLAENRQLLINDTSWQALQSYLVSPVRSSPALQELMNEQEFDTCELPSK